MKTLFKNKYLIIIPILILNIISLVYLYHTEYFNKQLAFIILGIIIFGICTKLNYKIINKCSKYFYFIALFLLGLVLVIGREIHGAKAWLHIANISIQPSEIAKLALIFYLIKLANDKKNIIYLLLVTLIPSVLTFLEPDTGAIIIFIIIFLSVLKYTKLNKKFILISLFLILLFISTNIFLYFMNKDVLINIYGTSLFYRIDRLISFKNQDNIQMINSLISIGSHNLIYIPESHNDFIFAGIISKYNSFIFILVIISYILIFIYYLNNLNKKKNISNMLNFIILNMLLFQVFYNILMNLSLLPIIGIPLPFLSYGGSYLITLYILIGFSVNLNIHSNKKMV